MYFSATFENRIPHIFNDTRQLVRSDMRMCISQYSRRSSMLAEYIEYLVYISSFLTAGIKFPVRISSCPPFSETIIGFRIYRMFPTDLRQVLFPFTHIFSAFYNHRA